MINSEKGLQSDVIPEEAKIKENRDGEVISDNEQIVEDGEIDTSNWKAYKNEEFGFRFRYPLNKFTHILESK